MSEWHVSWREIETEWTDEQFNLLLDQYLRRKIAEQEEAEGDEVVGEDELLGMMGVEVKRV